MAREEAADVPAPTPNVKAPLVAAGGAEGAGEAAALPPKANPLGGAKGVADEAAG